MIDPESSTVFAGVDGRTDTELPVWYRTLRGCRTGQRSRRNRVHHPRACQRASTDESARRAESGALVVSIRQGRTDPAYRWAIEWGRHLATDMPSDVERFNEFLEYLVTVGFANERHELR
jgi:hypothetical protein